MTTRPFRDWDDLRAMQAVCVAGLLARPGHASAHPGDIAWGVGWPPSTVEELGEKFLLWEESEEVVGFAALILEERDVSVFVMPNLRDTDAAAGFEDIVIDWVSSGSGTMRWSEFEDDSGAVERWRARGFRPSEDAYLNLTRPLDEVVGGATADERVRPVSEADVEDRAAITHAAFKSRKPLPVYIADYATFRASPAYPNGWDLLLRDPDGRGAACTIAWTDPVSRAGTFEPVATLPALHRRGFGRALLLEGLRRFAAAGMTYAIVGVYVHNPDAEALYRSVGFQADRLVRVYERASGRRA